MAIVGLNSARDNNGHNSSRHGGYICNTGAADDAYNCASLIISKPANTSACV